MECGRHTQWHSAGENLSFLPRQVSLYRLQIASKLGVGLSVHFTIYLHAGILFVLNSYRTYHVGLSAPKLEILISNSGYYPSLKL